MNTQVVLVNHFFGWFIIIIIKSMFLNCTAPDARLKLIKFDTNSCLVSISTAKTLFFLQIAFLNAVVAHKTVFRQSVQISVNACAKCTTINLSNAFLWLFFSVNDTFFFIFYFAWIALRALLRKTTLNAFIKFSKP